MIAQKSPTIGKAVAVLKELSSDEQTRLIYEEREKIRRDEQSKLVYAFSKGDHERSVSVATKLINKGYDTEEIIEISGLTLKQVEDLKNQLNG